MKGRSKDPEKVTIENMTMERDPTRPMLPRISSDCSSEAPSEERK